MKNIIYILLLIVVFSCKSEPKNKIEKKETNFNGIWGLTNYFDTIKKHKEITKYSMQKPNFFGILLDVQNDSISYYGTIYTRKNINKFNVKSDTLAIINGFIGGDWILQRNNKELHLKQIFDNNRLDTITYIYKKRDDLKVLLNKSEQKNDLWNNATDYFHGVLISGEYESGKSQNKVIFKKNGELKGLEPFNKYRIHNYFGTSHPYYPNDVIFLTNDNDKIFVAYNWKFNDDKLILTEFVPKYLYEKGKKYQTDNFVIGKKRIELKLINSNSKTTNIYLSTELLLKENFDNKILFNDFDKNSKNTPYHIELFDSAGLIKTRGYLKKGFKKNYISREYENYTLFILEFKNKALAKKSFNQYKKDNDTLIKLVKEGRLDFGAKPLDRNKRMNRILKISSYCKYGGLVFRKDNYIISVVKTCGELLTKKKMKWKEYEHLFLDNYLNSKDKGLLIMNTDCGYQNYYYENY